jgi:hypothetical protein
MSSLTRDGAMALQGDFRNSGMIRVTAVRFWAEPIAERLTKVGTYELCR